MQYPSALTYRYLNSPIRGIQNRLNVEGKSCHQIPLTSVLVCRSSDDQRDLWEKIFQLLFKSLAASQEEVVKIAKTGLQARPPPLPPS